MCIYRGSSKEGTTLPATDVLPNYSIRNDYLFLGTTLEYELVHHEHHVLQPQATHLQPSQSLMDVQDVLRWLVEAKIPVAKAMPLVSSLAAAGVKSSDGISSLEDAALARAVKEKPLLYVTLRARAFSFESRC